ncbi:MAG: O-antigen ligase family protein [Solirubrobacterales bacterium]|nr:O-antigen ligase family protein [Solirubrobacterales bacterium]
MTTAGLTPRRFRAPPVALAGALVVVVVAVMVRYGETALSLYGAVLPQAAVFVPLVGLATLFAARRPAGAVIGLVALAAFSGSMLAYVYVDPTLFITLLICATGIAVALGYASARTRPGLIPWPPSFLLGGYLLLSVVYVLFAPSFLAGAEGFARELLFPALLLVLAYGQWSGAVRRKMLLGVIFLCTAAALYAVLRYIIGPSGAEAAVPSAGFSQNVGGELSLLGSFANRQQLGGWTAVAIPALVALAFAVPPRWRIVCVVGVGASVVALLGSDTRVALVAAGAGLVVTLALLLLSRFARSQILAVAVGLLLVGVGGIGAYALTVGGDEQDADRYSNILTPTEDPTFDQRRKKWENVIDIVAPRPTGFGLGTAGQTGQTTNRFQSPDQQSIDNSYLTIAYQQGFAMTGLLVIALLAFVVALGRAALNASRPEIGGLAAAATGALVAWMVLMTAGIYIERYAALLACCLAGLATGQIVTRSEPDPADA